MIRLFSGAGLGVMGMVNKAGSRQGGGCGCETVLCGTVLAVYEVNG